MVNKPNYNDVTYNITDTWAESNLDQVERPISEKILTGWLYGEEPAHTHFNWLNRHINKWLKYFDTTIDSILASISGQVVVPIGTVLEYSAETLPSDNWDWADGGELSRSTYNTYFALVGTKFGTGDGSTTFNKPNRSGRVAVGYDSGQTEFDTIGKTGGNKSVTLTSDQIPSHAHDTTVSTNGLHSHNIVDPGHRHGHETEDRITHPFGSYGGNNYKGYSSVDGDTDNPLAYTSTNNTGITISNAGSHTHTVTVGSTGGNSAHSNLSPYITMRYIVRIK